MKITEESLLARGYEKKLDGNGQPIYVKGNKALVYNIGLWIPCHYSHNGPLAGRLYVNTIEELEMLGG